MSRGHNSVKRPDFPDPPAPQVATLQFSEFPPNAYLEEKLSIPNLQFFPSPSARADLPPIHNPSWNRSHESQLEIFFPPPYPIPPQAVLFPPLYVNHTPPQMHGPCLNMPPSLAVESHAPTPPTLQNLGLRPTLAPPSFPMPTLPFQSWISPTPLENPLPPTA